MKQYLKISEFAKLAGIPRKTLIFYDEIGLLKPERVLENKYRMYGVKQLETASVIYSLREIGMSLTEIREYLVGRTPETFLTLLREQREKIAVKIERLCRIEAMLKEREEMTKRAAVAMSSEPELKECQAELLFISEKVDDSSEDRMEQAAYDFYDLCDREGITYGYPLGAIVAKDSFLYNKEFVPNHYFFKFSQGEASRSNFEKPAGLYLIAYERVGYEFTRTVYARMISYMKEQGYCVAGASYEEYLLDEIAVKDPEDYLLQISIQVEKKNASL